MSVEVTSLENGLTVVTDSMSHLQTASVGVWVNTGARNENEREHGVSHMLEHMAFKGTEKRSAQAIAEEIETVGGHLNAHTTHEATAYYARVLSEDVPLAVDILGDILQNSAFDPAEVERERGVIISEIGQANDTPDDVVFDHLMEAAYRGQPLGRSILGTVDTVSSFQQDDLRQYMQKHYRAPGMVLAGAGGIDHAELVKMAEEGFSGLVSQRAENVPHAGFTTGEWREERELEQVHLTLALEGSTYSDPDYYTAQIFAGVLGGGMSSRLFQEVREKRGLCYSVFSFSWSFADTGIFGIYAGTSPDQVSELVKVLAGETKRMGEDVTEAEVARARAQIKAGLLMGLESSSSRVEQIARHYMIHGRVLPIGELIERLDSVDAASLRRYAGRLLEGKGLALSAIGPLQGKNGGLESYDQIAARFAN